MEIDPKSECSVQQTSLIAAVGAAAAATAAVEDETVVGEGAELDVDLDAVDGVVGGEHGHQRGVAAAAGEAGHLDAVVRGRSEEINFKIFNSLFI